MRFELTNRIVVVELKSRSEFDRWLTSIRISTTIFELTIVISIQNRSFSIYFWLKDRFKSTKCQLIDQKWQYFNRNRQIISKTTLKWRNLVFFDQFPLKFDLIFDINARIWIVATNSMDFSHKFGSQKSIRIRFRSNFGWRSI